MNKVTIIIVNWNGIQFLPKCLDGLRRQTFKDFFTILVDNGSEDNSVKFVTHHYPEIKVISLPKNIGFSAANNIALKSINTEYIALLNNDAVPDSNWLARLVQALDENPKAGFAASKLLFYSQPEMIDRAGDAHTRAGVGFLRGRGCLASDYSKQEWIFGACAAAAIYRTDMLKNIGHFDENFFLLYEDVDLSFRAQLMGYKCLYVPEAIAYHMASSSIVRDSSTSIFYGHRNLEWVYLKNMPAKLIFKTIVSHILYDVASLLFFITRGRGKDYIRAKISAIKGFHKMLEKRREIQKNKNVSDHVIWDLLDCEPFFPRLTSRLVKMIKE